MIYGVEYGDGPEPEHKHKCPSCQEYTPCPALPARCVCPEQWNLAIECGPCIVADAETRAHDARIDAMTDEQLAAEIRAEWAA